MPFADCLREVGVDEETIARIVDVGYVENEAKPDDGTADFYAAVVRRCDELLDFDTFSEAMFRRSCCKSGYRMNNAKQLAKEHGAKSLEERLALLGELRYMGKPALNADGDIESVAVGAYGMEGMRCPCWRLKGHNPSDGPMPLNYCLCCAGHFRFHYQKALGLDLRVKKVVSTQLNSDTALPCVFIFEILGETQPKRGRRSASR